MGDNGDPIIVCCILGLCCPAGSASQVMRLTQLLQQARPHLTTLQAQDKAEQILKHYKHFELIRAMVDGE